MWNRSFVVIVLFVLVCMAPRVKAQYNETIRTGRPGQSIGPWAVGAHVLQVQAGMQFAGSNTTKLDQRILEPGAVVRYGLGRTFEVNTSWAWQDQRSTFDEKEFDASGVSASALGFRVNMIDGVQGGPALGFQLWMELPLESDVQYAEELAPTGILIASFPLTDRLTCLTNLGVDYDGISPRADGLYVVNMTYSLSSKWSTFVENYGSFGSGFETRWDGGLAYQANNNLQWDLYGGWGDNDGVQDFFINAGISYRILTKRTTDP